MNIIYKPKGKAREYSPLAINYFTGCDHNCLYCYAPNIRRMTREQYNHVSIRKNILIELKKQLKREKIKNQVLLQFMSDPYCNFNEESNLTAQILLLLLEYRIPVSILSKGGRRILTDMEIFKKYGGNIMVGATLVCDNDEDCKKWESGAALTNERLEVLKELHNNNIKTWASFEPVIDIEQSLELIRKSLKYIDLYKIGKLNNYKGLDKDMDWNYFLKTTVNILRENKKDFYIKNDLRKYANGFKLYGNECNMDEFNIEWSE